MNPEFVQYMLDALRTSGKEITEWEKEFLDTIKDHFKRNRRLSNKEADTLERIYSEKTP